MFDTPSTGVPPGCHPGCPLVQAGHAACAVARAPAGPARSLEQGSRARFRAPFPPDGRSNRARGDGLRRGGGGRGGRPAGRPATFVVSRQTWGTVSELRRVHAGSARDESQGSICGAQWGVQESCRVFGAGPPAGLQGDAWAARASRNGCEALSWRRAGVFGAAGVGCRRPSGRAVPDGRDSRRLDGVGGLRWFDGGRSGRCVVSIRTNVWEQAAGPGPL